MNKATQSQTRGPLNHLVAIGKVPKDYSRDELIRYMTVLEAQAYDNLETIDRLTERIRELEDCQQRKTL